MKKPEPAPRTVMPPPAPAQIQVQPIVLNSPGGAYITIQRIKETNTQSHHVMKQLGLNGFRDMTKQFKSDNTSYGVKLRLRF